MNLFLHTNTKHHFRACPTEHRFPINALAAMDCNEAAEADDTKEQQRKDTKWVATSSEMPQC